MQNGSEAVLFLQGLNDSALNRQVFFTLALTSYVFTVLVNLTLILTVCLEKSLHEPMYLLLSSQCLNGVCGASCFYPKLLHDLLARVHVVPLSGCLVQIWAVYSYVFCEFTGLTVMAYDRYLAICRPLQYRTLMPLQKVGRLVLFTWSFAVLEALGGTVLTARLPLCRRHLPKIFCTNWEVVKLSCSDTTANNVYGFLMTFSQMFQIGLILVSYTHLVRASLRLQSDRRRFLQTCLPHLLTLLVFFGSLLFDAMYSRYGGRTLQVLQNLLAAEFLVVPPLINPIIYGIKLHRIRAKVLHYLQHRPGK